MHTVHEGWIKLQNCFSSQASSVKFWRRMIIVAAIILCLAALSLSLPAQGQGLAPSQTVRLVTVLVTPQPTLSPTSTRATGAEVDSNRDETTGVIVGAIFLVIIIVAGTLLTERSMKEH